MDLDAIFAIAGIGAMQVDNSYAIYDGKEYKFTLTPVDETTTRIEYPEGHEYTHTTMWGTPLTENLIKKYKYNILMSKLDAERSKLNGY